jgi:hypothetical protein
MYKEDRRGSASRDRPAADTETLFGPALRKSDDEEAPICNSLDDADTPRANEPWLGRDTRRTLNEKTRIGE